MSPKPLHLLALAALAACTTPHDAQVSIPGAADAERALLTSMHDVDLAGATTGAGPAVGKLTDSKTGAVQTLDLRDLPNEYVQGLRDGSCRVPGCWLAGEWLAVPTSF